MEDLMKKEIIICLGSSCFSKGNKQTVQTIKQYIKDHQLEDKVYFHGSHCFGNCENGPTIKVDDKEYQNVSPDNITYLLDKILSTD
ncbi:MAG: NAD(P)H-dependent oxidoreductase subunit E [Bacteroidota bacterium]|nr:NAD(P)H-dependent oxidoreductase subunit E [Bacteroidota bacterium]